MGKRVQLFVCLAVLVASMRSTLGAPSGHLSDPWSRFKRDFNKSYHSAQEEAFRRELFLDELRRIETHNADPSASYKLGINRMSDWTEAEFNRLLSLSRPLSAHQSPAVHPSSELDPILRDLLGSDKPIPREVDWRRDGRRVGPVKDQNDCGSCWAFATTGLLEGQQVARNFTKRLVPLSEQQLLDCIEGDGCQGNWPSKALEAISSMGGIMSERDYKYTASDLGLCLKQEDQFVMHTSGPILLPYGDEELMARAVALYGPIAVSVAAHSWKSYLSGVWPGSVCEGGTSHAVLIVGYGQDAYGTDYWIIKNSWGQKMGEDGYMRIQRGVNACKIAADPTIAAF